MAAMRLGEHGTSVAVAFGASVFLGLAWPSAALAQSIAEPSPAVDSSGHVTVTAVPVTEVVTLDGRLDEAIYAEVASTGGFIQQEPREGEPATERTEVWVLFDRRTLYVSARCFDSQPHRMVANELRRDHQNIAQNESLAVILDTFQDGRNGFLFQTNALGALRDGLITDERTANFDWNTVWDVQTQRTSEGWTLEMAIPFKSLRYAGGVDQVWGINFQRFVRWKNEQSHLSPIPASYGEDGVYRVSQAASLVDLRIDAGTRHLELKPYAISGVTTNLSAAPAFANDLDGDVGFDAKYNLTKGLTADFTYNTDFAQVEVDDEQVNLTRFNLFFPEKREFFLEGQGIFEFGGPERQQWRRPSNAPIVFFSRRIGLSGAGEVPIRAGGRVTGRAGQYSIGILGLGTGTSDTSKAAATGFGVVRVRRDILRRSSIGFIGTYRSVGLDGAGANQVYGADVSLAFRDNLSVTGFYARSRTPNRDGREYTYRARLENVGDRYGIEYEHLVVGENFNPEIGFLRRRGFRRNYVQLLFTPRPAAMPLIRKFRYEASVDYITSLDGRLESREARFAWASQFQHGDELWIEYNGGFEFLPQPFEISRGVVLPVGDYNSHAFVTTYSLGAQRRLSGWLGFVRGSFFDGDRTEARFMGRYEVTPTLSLEPGLTLNWIDLPQGSFLSRLVRGRVTYTLSPRSFLAALVQYNTGTESLSTNVRFRWEYEPGSDLYVVYTEGRDTETTGYPGLENRALVMKFTKLFRF